MAKYTHIHFIDGMLTMPKNEENIITTAKERRKGAKRVPFNAHMIAMFTQTNYYSIIIKYIGLKAMTIIEEKKNTNFFSVHSV